LNSALGKTGQKSGFFPKFKGTVPKAEVLEQPPLSQIILYYGGLAYDHRGNA
jgi:hypothetical protein